MTEHHDADGPCELPECGNCQRKDVCHIDDYRVNIVTYVGEYVVSTIVAPELKDKLVQALQMMGITQIPTFVILVGYVGEGSIEDSKTTVPDDQFIRWLDRHSNIASLKENHDMVVDMVRNGVLDLTEPVPMEVLEEQSRSYFKDAMEALKGRGDGTTFGLDF
jgi:hypothetical protein